MYTKAQVDMFRILANIDLTKFEDELKDGRMDGWPDGSGFIEMFSLSDKGFVGMLSIFQNLNTSNEFNILCKSDLKSTETGSEK